MNFEVFRPVLVEALDYGERPKGGRPPYDAVVMFKVLVLALMHNLSDERMEFLIRDRFSWLRFLGFQIGEPTPDQKTIWLFREKLTQAGVCKALFAAFEAQLCARFLCFRHPLARGKDQRGIHNLTAGRFVSPRAELSFKRGKQGLEDTRLGQLLSEKPDRLLIRCRLPDLKSQEP